MTPTSITRLVWDLHWVGRFLIFMQILFIVVMLIFFTVAGDSLNALFNFSLQDVQSYHPLLDLSDSEIRLYLLFNMLINLPTLGFILLVWTIHNYLKASGALTLLNQVTTTIGLIGLGGATLALLMDFQLVYVLRSAHEAGDIIYSDIIAIYAVMLSLFNAGNILFFVVYLFLLVGVSWQKKLLPHWLNGVNLSLATLYALWTTFWSELAIMGLLIVVLIVLWVFSFAVFFLVKAQELAEGNT